MSKNIEKLSARLGAVQALYQASQNKDDAAGVVDEYLEHRVSMDVDGDEMVEMDKDLFKRVMDGVLEQGKELETLISENYSGENKAIEPLLKSILLCGVFELKNHQDIDSPIIINDYLNVAHSFYGKSEVSLVNGILDKFQSFRG